MFLRLVLTFLIIYVIFFSSPLTEIKNDLNIRRFKLAKMIMGSETEYAILVKGASDARPDNSAAYLLLKKCPYPFFSRSHLYGWRRRDGDFQIEAERMARLLAGPEHLTAEDKEWFQEHFDLPLSQRSEALIGALGLLLENGSRFYVDMSHPEFSTAEVTNARDLILYEKAGEIIVEASRRKASAELGQEIKIYKNNSDGKGSSYACHENYLVPASLFREITRESMMSSEWYRQYYERNCRNGASSNRGSLAGIFAAFLITRQIFCGAGKIGVEREKSESCYLREQKFRHFTGRSERCGEYVESDIVDSVTRKTSNGVETEETPATPVDKDAYRFQISQRADFFTRLYSAETTRERGIINTRDRSYLNDFDFSRLHVIIGDSNMAEWSIFLKTGVTALILDWLSSGFAERLGHLAFKEPVKALREISFDLTCKKAVIKLANGTTVSALDVQKELLKAVKEYRGNNLTSVEADVIEKWSYALDALERDPSLLDDKLDWRIKKRIFERYLVKCGANWDNCGRKTIKTKKSGVAENLGCWLKQLDIEYHNINPDTGVYHVLQNQGAIKRIVSGEEISNAVGNPPTDTRAYIRGMAARHLKELITDMHWHILEIHGLGRVQLDPFDCTKGIVDVLLKKFK